jgi:hypothetical protein
MPALSSACFCILGAVVLGFPSGITAEQPGLAVSVDRTIVTIGDEIRYQVAVRCPPGYTVLPPDVSGEFGPFSVKALNSSERKDKSFEGTERIWTFVLARFETGTTNIPAMQIRFKGPEGEGVLTTRPVPVTVNSVIAAGQTNVDIRDIKPQMTMKDKWLWLKLLVLLLVCAAGAAGFLWWRHRRKKPLEVEARAEVARLPEDQEALEALDRIAASDVLEKEGIKQYYTLVSEVVRTYLARRYGVMTLERTTDEILAELSGLYIEREIVDMVRHFLEESDIVKFAKHIPDKNEIKALIDKARAIVIRTRTVPGSGDAGPGDAGSGDAGSGDAGSGVGSESTAAAGQTGGAVS